MNHQNKFEPATSKIYYLGVVEFRHTTSSNRCEDGLRVYLADATSFDGKDQPVYDSVADKGMSHWFYMGDVKHTQIYGALCALQWLTGPIDASTGPPGEPFG